MNHSKWPGLDRVEKLMADRAYVKTHSWYFDNIEPTPEIIEFHRLAMRVCNVCIFLKNNGYKVFNPAPEKPL